MATEQSEKRVYTVTVEGAGPEESGQVLAALKGLEAEANKSISGTVSVDMERETLDTEGFSPAGGGDD